MDGVVATTNRGGYLPFDPAQNRGKESDDSQEESISESLLIGNQAGID